MEVLMNLFLKRFLTLMALAILTGLQITHAAEPEQNTVLSQLPLTIDYGVHSINSNPRKNGGFEINQDKILAIKDPNTNCCALFGVFDGHGYKTKADQATIIDSNFHAKDFGGLIADKVAKMLLFYLNENSSITFRSENFYQTIAKNIQSYLNSSPESETEKLSEIAQTGGTTACYACIYPDETVDIVNVGDSRAILLDEECNLVYATNDHKPLYDFKELLEKLKDETPNAPQYGGYDQYHKEEIANIKDTFIPSCMFMYLRTSDFWRIAGLACSRSFGDLHAHQKGLTCDIDLGKKPIKANYTLIIATDGLWDFLTIEKAQEIIQANKDESSQRLATILAENAQNQNNLDDISVVVVQFKEKTEPIKEEVPANVKQPTISPEPAEGTTSEDPKQEGVASQDTKNTEDIPANAEPNSSRFQQTLRFVNDHRLAIGVTTTAATALGAWRYGLTPAQKNRLQQWVREQARAAATRTREHIIPATTTAATAAAHYVSAAAQIAKNTVSSYLEQVMSIDITNLVEVSSFNPSLR